jgi:cation diffusion facilitator family transporter
MKISNRQLGLFEGILSSVLNSALFVVKYWVGISIGSIAMVADSWHTLSDTLTSLVVIVGFWFSGRPQDREHPFGHGRAEVIGALIIGVLLGVVGINFLSQSILNLVHHLKAPHFTHFAIGVFAVSVILKEGLARFSIWAGKKINSQALIGDGWHHRSDAIASLLIVIGALFGQSLWWIDGVMGIGVALLILWAAYDVTINSANVLLGEEMDPKLEKEIHDIITELAPEMSNIHHLHLHRYGDHREITLHIRMPGDLTLLQAHEKTTQIERRLRSDLNIEATVHMEPTREKT